VIIITYVHLTACLPCNAMLVQYVLLPCVYVCQSVYYMLVLYQNGYTSIMQTTPHNIPGTLVFLCRPSSWHSDGFTSNGGVFCK